MDARAFRAGDRIRLIRMADPYREAPEGMLGTVIGTCPPPVNVLDVDWDGPFGLNPCLDEDIVEKVGDVRNGREFYSVLTDDDGRKVVKYQGWTWRRPDGGPKGYACTEVCGCYLDVTNVGPEEDIKDAIAFIAEACQQYQEDMDERAFFRANLGFFAGGCSRLDVADVGPDTPDGDYFYEVEGQ